MTETIVCHFERVQFCGSVIGIKIGHAVPLDIVVILKVTLAFFGMLNS